MLKITDPISDEYIPVSESCKLIGFVADSFQQQLSEMDNREKFHEINKKVLKQSETGEMIVISKPNRVLVLENDMYITTTKNSIIERKRRPSKAPKTHIDINKNETNPRFYEDASLKCVGFLFNDMIMICSTVFSPPQTPRSEFRETPNQKKKLKQVDTLLGKKSMRFKYQIPLEKIPICWTRNIVSPENMFQIVTPDVIYTFKMESEELKKTWMKNIDLLIIELTKPSSSPSPVQPLLDVTPVETSRAISRGYLDIPEEWLQPSLLIIQSISRRYLTDVRTQRIKKKGRKNNKNSGSLDHVVERVTKLDILLQQNQNFVQTYGKKKQTGSAVTLLKNYEEDVNEEYIEVEEEVDDTDSPRYQNIVPISQPRKGKSIDLYPKSEQSTPKTPQDEPKSVTIEEVTTPQPNNSNEIPPSTPLENNVPTSIEPTSSIQETDHSASTNSQIHNVPSRASVRFSMSGLYSNEIVYEDEFGNQFVVRVGDEIVYEDEDGNQVSEIVTPEKFLEMVEASRLEQASLEPAVQSATQENTQIEVPVTHIETVQQVTTETVKDIPQPKVEEPVVPIKPEATPSAVTEPTSNTTESNNTTAVTSTTTSESTSTVQSKTTLPKLVSPPPQTAETITSPRNREVFSPRNGNSSEEQELKRLRGGSVTKEPTEVIAPWQKELLNKYKGDGKFKYVTETAEQKLQVEENVIQSTRLSDARLSDARLSEADISPQIQVDGSMVDSKEEQSSSVIPLQDKRIQEEKKANRQSIRVSSEFHNYLNKFKTFEKKE